MRRPGFTLLEVVLAMVILATFAVVTLQMRMEGLRAGRSIARGQRVQRALDDVLSLARAQMLPDPRPQRDDRGEIVRVLWEGDYFDLPYTCVQDTAEVPAPETPNAAPASAPAHAVTVTVRRLTATIGDERAVLYLPRPVRR